MKTEIHPEYVESHVTCTCGNEFTTRSTKSQIHVEICAACHPFYTGRQKLVDTGGRVERFQRRVAKGRRQARALHRRLTPRTHMSARGPSAPLTASRDAPVGGQAVLEGVMMRGVRHWAVAVRTPAGEIEVQSFPLAQSAARAPALVAPAGAPRRGGARRVAGDRPQGARHLSQRSAARGRA